MIPPFDQTSGYLPPGIHSASWEEFNQRFGTSERRRDMIAGLKLALTSLQAAGCKVAYIDGSFVTAKNDPADFDACWDAKGVDILALDPILLDFSPNRPYLQKAKYLGEFLPAQMRIFKGGPFVLDFFQLDVHNNAKGIILLDLTQLP